MAEDESSRTTGVKPARSGKYGSVDPDAAVVAACLRGDVRAWEALIERFQGFILSIAFRRGLSRSDAEDVFQNVCLKLYEHLGELRDVQKLSGWIAAVTVRESAQIYRKDPVRVFSEAAPQSDGEDAPESLHASPDAGPEDQLLALERREVVRRMLGELSDECRKLLTMLYVAEEPQSYNKVAEDLKMPLGSIGPKRARCLARLKALLESIGY